MHSVSPGQECVSQERDTRDAPEIHRQEWTFKVLQSNGHECSLKDTEMEDNSENLNIGLINMEEKNSTSYEFYGIRWSDLLEICLGIIVILYITKLVFKYIRKKR